MRTINKKVILLSIILATVLLNTSDIYASSVKKNYVNKNQELIKNNATAIENSLKNNDYNLFVTTIRGLGITDTVTTEQFSILVRAYNLFKQDKKDEAIKLLSDNKLNPLLIKFINHRPDLTDAQKEVLKKASDLIKQGKIDEGKALIASLGLSNIPADINKKIIKVENKTKREEMKKAFDTVRELKKLGKIDEAKKLLKDIGVPNLIQDKISIEFNKAPKGDKISFLQSVKNLFIK